MIIIEFDWAGEAGKVFYFTASLDRDLCVMGERILAITAKGDDRAAGRTIATYTELLHIWGLGRSSPAPRCLPCSSTSSFQMICELHRALIYGVLHFVIHGYTRTMIATLHGSL